MSVAAIDCGTNSLRLLIATTDGHGGLVDLDRRTEIVRLGQGVDATGQFHPDALARTFAVVEAYADLIARAGITPDRVHFVATSAARDAGNRDDFFAGISDRLGVLPDIISGDAEAQLSYAGALSRVRPDHGPVLVTDIGGGSTELIVGSTEGEVASALSIDVGSVRLTERFLRAGPPAPADLDRARAYVDNLLDRSGVDFAGLGSWVGVAGTVTTLAGVFLGLDAYDRDRVHGAHLPRTEVIALSHRLDGLDVAAIRALPSMHPQRADVIAGGALVAERIAVRTRVADLVVSESDILDGIALDLLRRS